MDTLFDLSNIAAGMILGISILKNIEGIGKKLQEFSAWLLDFKHIFGIISLLLGFAFLLKPGYALHDIVGILAGLLLLSEKLEQVPTIGEYLAKAAKALVPIEAAVGIAAIVVGFLGLLNIPFLA